MKFEINLDKAEDFTYPGCIDALCSAFDLLENKFGSQCFILCVQIHETGRLIKSLNDNIFLKKSIKK